MDDQYPDKEQEKEEVKEGTEDLRRMIKNKRLDDPLVVHLEKTIRDLDRLDDKFNENTEEKYGDDQIKETEVAKQVPEEEEGTKIAKEEVLK